MNEDIDFEIDELKNRVLATMVARRFRQRIVGQYGADLEDVAKKASIVVRDAAEDVLRQALMPGTNWVDLHDWLEMEEHYK